MSTELQQRIVKAASELFIRHGIRAITMDMIAARLGISKRTLYENFGDKNELLMACLEVEEQEQKQRWEKHYFNRKNVIDLLLQVYNDMLSMMHNVSPLFFEDLRRYHPKANDRYEDDIEYHKQNTIRLLTEGVQEGLIRNDVNLEIAASLLSVQIEMLKKSDRVFNSQYSFPDIFDTLFKSFIRGLATPEGVKYADNYFNNRENNKKL